MEMIKIVATAARTAITIKHCFAMVKDEQGWTVVFCVVTTVGFGVLVGNILVTTGINPPCVAFVVMKIDPFVEGISAVVADMLVGVGVWMWDPVVDWFLIRDPVVVEKFLVFSVLSVWLTSTDPSVALAGSVVVAEDWMNSPLVMLWLFFTVVVEGVVCFTDVVVANSLLFSDASDVEDTVIADIVFILPESVGVNFLAVENAVVFGSGFSSTVVMYLAATVDVFDAGCGADVKTGAFVDVVSTVALSDVLESDFGSALDFSTNFVSAIIIPS